jgi:hypothetical protein
MLIVNDIILILILLMIAIFSVDRFNCHRQRMIEICRKSPNEAQQGFIPGKPEHGRARWEEDPGSTILGLIDKRQGDRHSRGAATDDDQAKESEGWTMAKEREEQTAVAPKGHL